MEQNKKRPRIGVLVGDGSTEYVDRFTCGVERCAKEKDIDIVYFTRLKRPALESEDDTMVDRYGYQYDLTYQMAGRGTFDALLVVTGSIWPYLGEEGIRVLTESFKNVPFITLEDEIPGAACCLKIDNYNGIREIVLHLIEKHGYRRIGYVGGSDNTIEKERSSGFFDAIRMHHLENESMLLMNGDYSEFIDKEFEEAMEKHPDLEAVVFANDEMAKAGYRYARKHGLVVGKDIAFTGFDDTGMARKLSPMLTTVSQHVEELGYQGMSLAVEAASGRKLPLECYSSVVCKFRNSCGCRQGRDMGETATQDDHSFEKTQFHLESWLVPLFIQDIMEMDGEILFQIICKRMRLLGVKKAEIYIYETPLQLNEAQKILPAAKTVRMAYYDEDAIITETKEYDLKEVKFELDLFNDACKSSLAFFPLFFGNIRYGFIICDLKEFPFASMFSLSQQIGILISLQKDAMKKKKENRELLSDLSRLRESTLFIMKSSSDIVFEYERDTDSYKATNSVFRMDQTRKTPVMIVDFMEYIDAHAFANKKLTRQMSELLNEVYKEGERKSEKPVKARFNCSDKRFENSRTLWIEIEARLVEDLGTRKKLVVGKIRDITEEVVKEQLSKERFLRDQVTKLYNYLYGRELVDGRIQKNQGKGSFFVLVITNFEGLGEAYGSTYVNTLLENFAGMLKEVCGNEAVLVKLRGPVFSGYLESEEISGLLSEIEQRAKNIYVGNKKNSQFELKTFLTNVAEQDTFDRMYGRFKQEVAKFMPSRTLSGVKTFEGKGTFFNDGGEINEEKIKKGYDFVREIILILEESRETKSAVMLSLNQIGRFFGLERILVISELEGKKQKIEFQWTKDSKKHVADLSERKSFPMEVKFNMMEAGKKIGYIFLEGSEEKESSEDKKIRSFFEKTVMEEVLSILSSHISRLWMKERYREKSGILLDLSNEIDVLLSKGAIVGEKRLECLRFQSMLDAICELAKLETDDYEVKERGYSILYVLQDAFREIAEIFRHRGGFLDVDIDPVLPKRLVGDREKIEKILFLFLKIMKQGAEDYVKQGIGFVKKKERFHLVIQAELQAERIHGSQNMEVLWLDKMTLKKLLDAMGAELIEEYTKEGNVLLRMEIPQGVQEGTPCVRLENSEERQFCYRPVRGRWMEKERDMVRRSCLRLGVAYKEQENMPQMSEMEENRMMDAVTIAGILNARNVGKERRTPEDYEFLCSQLLRVPGINMEEALRHSQGMINYIQAVEDYLYSIEIRAEYLSRALEKENWEEIGILLHTIVYTSKHAGVLAFSKKAEDLSEKYRADNYIELRELLPGFLMAYRNQKIVLGEIMKK